jgi:phosphoribosyl-ATP pyrophosphohydrolase
MERFDLLLATIIERRSADPATSYVARLTARGRAKMAQKLGEEAVEVVIAAMAEDSEAARAGLISESADLIFHLALLLADAGLSFDDVRAELARREGMSGIEEKAKRAT